MRLIESPSDVTRRWKAERVNGLDGYYDPVEDAHWVPARKDETPEVRVTFTRTPGLPPLDLVRREQSVTARRADRKERREQRELRKRGLA